MQLSVPEVGFNFLKLLLPVLFGFFKNSVDLETYILTRDGYGKINQIYNSALVSLNSFMQVTAVIKNVLMIYT